jgi:hypothetical protein
MIVRTMRSSRAWLKEILAPEVAALRELTARRFDEWAEDFPLPPMSVPDAEKLSPAP